MAEAAPQRVTVFGGTGFLGRRICRRLVDAGVRVRAATRHPERVGDIAPDAATLEATWADVHDALSVERAVDGADAVVNAVSLYVESEGATFESVHVEGAAAVARAAVAAGARQVVSLSGIGADPASSSAYIAARGRGEEAVRAAVSDAVLLRPCVMCGPGDGFLTMLRGFVRKYPVMPLFGEGETRLQPVFVEDVAATAVRILTGEESAKGSTYELGGPDVFAYRDLLESIAEHENVALAFVPLPFGVWSLAASAAERLPNPPLYEGQVDLMRHDNVVTGTLPGFAALGIRPTPVAAVLDALD